MGWSGPMTYRHFLAWQAWLDEDMNRPDRNDHYLMLAAHEARYSNRKRKPFRPRDYVIKFSTKSKLKEVPDVKGGPRRVTKEDIIRIQKERQERMVAAAQGKGRSLTKPLPAHPALRKNEEKSAGTPQGKKLLPSTAPHAPYVTEPT